MRKIIAIAISDLHLTLTRPACRTDKDWMAIQADYLKQVKDIAKGRPILAAGDIFDKWKAEPELINFALEHLPQGMICVPGQHDLPNHRMDLMHRSGYGVLVQAGKIIDISGGEPYKTKEFVVIGFGWNEDIPPLKKRINNTPHIALIHKYIYLNKETSFPGAPEENHYSNLEKILRTYDSVVIGDNHIHWAV